MFKLSIGISAFNEQGNIIRLLLSLLEQKKNNFALEEIIVVSDGSNDATNKQLKKIKSRRIKKYIGRIRLGQISRLNQIKSMMSSKSEGLLILEADSYPVDEYFISNLIKGVPEDKNYSYVVADVVL